MICIVDYGMGNLRSVSKALEKVGGEVRVSSRPEDVKSAQKVVLPGVGAFGDAAVELGRRSLSEPLREILRKGKPFFGICLGMQLLLEESEESPGIPGLGIFKGKVRRFQDPNVKIPHIGWNQLKTKKADFPAFRTLPAESFFYFVHSYFPVPQDASLVLGETDYGNETFPSFIGNETIWAAQFHPEKSQEAGLQMMRNFVTR